MNGRTIILAVIAVATTGSAALAQSSASYRLEETVINSGGHPTQGTTLASASYRIRLDALGEGVVGATMSGTTYRVDSGFGSAFLPPGEVRGLRFAGVDTLTWDPDPAAGTYNLYRDLLSAAAGHGGCHEQGIHGTSTVDADVAAPGEGYFYLVTVANRVAEEGTKGADSAGASRGGAACP